jgi:hypothetical protein
MQLPVWTHRALAATASAVVPALAALSAGCSSAPRLTGGSHPPVDVISWACGPEQRTPEARGDRRLLLLPSSQPLGSARPVLRSCLPVESFLPAPPPDERIFLLIGGRLHVRVPGAEPVPLPGSDPDLGVTHLLAFTKHQSPLEMLVSAKPRGSSSWQLWTLALEDRAIQSAKEVAMDARFASKEAFFAAYTAPRCLEGGRRCLVPRWDGQRGYVEEEVFRDESSVTLEDLGGVRVADAAWASADGSQMYLLLPCN